MDTSRKERHTFVNIMLFLCIISSIGSVVSTLLYKGNDLNLLYLLTNVVLLFLFSVFFVSSSITNNTKHKGSIFVSALLLTIYNTLGILITMNVFTFPTLNKVEDFRGKSLTTVVDWATKNNIELDQEYEYSDMIGEYKVISQNLKPGSNPKDKILTVSISEGPSPNKDVVIPNMVTWDSERVLKFIKKNHLSNVDVEFTESDKVRDTLIEQSKSGNMKRNDSIKLTFSLGDDPLESPRLIDLTKKTEFEAVFYLKQHKIKYNINKDFSKIKRGLVSKQSIKPGTVIKDQEVNITISKGKKIKVPNLKKMDIDSITKWVITNRLKLDFTDQYDEKIKDNHVISANYKKGSIIEQGSLVTIVISKGKLKMPKFKSLADFYEWADKYKIKYQEKHEFSESVKQGEVIKYSVKAGKAIKNNETIIVTISDGKECKVPNLKDLTKSEAIKKLKDAHLNYNFVYKNSNSIKKDRVMSQSISAGKKVSSNTTVTVTLSNGKKEVVEARKSSSKSTSRKTTPSKPSTPTCTPKTYVVSGSMRNVFNSNSGYSAVSSALYSFFRSNYPNVKISVVGVGETGMSSGSYVSGIAPGSSVTSCQASAYVIRIAK
ncbi:MAG: PASTA domain-containing protein [Bacilli bacterium]|nr:PASTA domain-containing protein [Bacilli bacterium]